MDLLHRVTAEMKVEEAKAEKGVGAILLALRLSVDKDVWERVKQAVPLSERMIGKSLATGARTAEMPALIGPAGLASGLANAGFNKDEIPSLGRIVLDHLRPTLGDATVERFLSGAPALRG